jgi:hypothetical protein
LPLQPWRASPDYVSLRTAVCGFSATGKTLRGVSFAPFVAAPLSALCDLAR